MPFKAAWLRPSWRTLLESARESLRAPAVSAVDVVLRALLFVTVIG